MAPVVRLLRQTPEVETRTCATAQHRQMLDQALELFGIQPEYDLDLMRDDQSMAQISAGVFSRLDPVLEEFKPDWVLAVGDTTTVVTTSLLAFYRRIKFGHIEAGLRTHDKWHPFPEEINRRIATVTADLHFAPTEWSKGNLLREGVPADRIHVTGNTVIDALLWVVRYLEEHPEKQALIAKRFAFLGNQKRLILITGHRRENFGQGFEQICRAIQRLATRPDVELVYPVHLNPNVRKPVFRLLGALPNVHLIDPLDYLPFVYLIGRSYLLLTDSGGIQEEAPALGKPVLVMRDETERPEALEAGTAKLVGTDDVMIVDEVTRLLDDPKTYEQMSSANNPYGDGRASERIIKEIFRRHGV